MNKNEVCFVLTKLIFYKCQRDSLIRTKNYLLYIIDIWLFFFLFQNYFNDLHSVSGFLAMIGLLKTTRYEWKFLTCKILKTTFFSSTNQMHFNNSRTTIYTLYTRRRILKIFKSELLSFSFEVWYFDNLLIQFHTSKKIEC